MKLIKKQKAVITAIAWLALTGVLWGIAPEPEPAKAFVPPTVVKKVETPKRTPADVSRSQARSLLPFYGWNETQFACLNKIWIRESNWNNLSFNKTPVVVGQTKLHAYGIAQRLGEKNHKSEVQIKHGFDYIAQKYKTPCFAWAFWQNHNWY
jgi:hypothetical protein